MGEGLHSPAAWGDLIPLCVCVCVCLVPVSVCLCVCVCVYGLLQFSYPCGPQDYSSQGPLLQAGGP